MKIEMERIRPEEIEKRSFEIIGEELGQKGIVLPAVQAPIIKRCIHTSADFDYAENLKFSDGAVEEALAAIKGGASIVTDTRMAYSGINKKCLEQYGGRVYCFMSDEDVAAAAKEQGTTRNAPTALIRLCEMIQEGRIAPRLVIGVPVGFVNVVQSKELLMALKGTAYIAAEGRKGGSNIAACICNALFYML